MRSHSHHQSKLKRETRLRRIHKQLRLRIETYCMFKVLKVLFILLLSPFLSFFLSFSPPYCSLLSLFLSFSPYLLPPSPPLLSRSVSRGSLLLFLFFFLTLPFLHVSNTVRAVHKKPTHALPLKTNKII